MRFHKLSIKAIARETDKAVRITFDVPSSLNDAFRFKAGQYITLKSTVNGDEVRRDYSICTPPKSHRLSVVVKAVENGRFSSFANSTLKVGDVMEVAEPQGRFVFEPEAHDGRDVLAIAAGSGITPIMGILKTVLEHTDLNCALLYGNKSPEDTIFLNALTDMATAYPDRFKVKHVFSRSSETDALFGRIDSSKVKYFIKSMCGDMSVGPVYLCGPEDMINTASDTLIESGHAADDIFFELFTKAPQADETKAISESDGTISLTVTVDDEVQTFNVSKSKSLLEAALDNNVDAPYSCQGGVCSSCLARIKEGKAHMRQNSILTDSEVESGFILTCQAYADSSHIHIDYDDI